ncbi:hypothetical protein [Phormidium tenue]|uniref:Uncharacterized protein n=1 Tax=Phormidium tenue NIES-30 TaxID=549789 RepID=A0A1U7J3X4_9CYAN|nr:hypothetical protein [Phormidium tenue]MBD2233025.1 hypothetical protein [Phormidium tenue FACHB-1052]OKH47157.1 hypothetical protein NIES30_14365 [Phormidium tenue NIES-30]
MYRPDKVQAYLTSISESHSPVEDVLKRNVFKYGLWLLAIPAIIYGAIDRGVAAFSGSVLDVTNLSYCLIGLVILLAWICIGLADDPSAMVSLEETEKIKSAIAPASDYIAQQTYRLPFPYLCQVYHLLNVQHLEDIHRFSLGNLKVVKVSDFQKTQEGGKIRFETMLDSPFNVLRLWRNPVVEVELTIHSPHQIELKVPAYGQKFIRILFNVVPLNAEEHHLSIQMFSNLAWPKELFKAVLILASSLTLLEDLPYLNHLARRNYGRLFSQVSEKRRSNQAMQLFHRYADLYNDSWKYRQLQLLDY